MGCCLVARVVVVAGQFLEHLFATSVQILDPPRFDCWGRVMCNFFPGGGLRCFSLKLVVLMCIQPLLGIILNHLEPAESHFCELRVSPQQSVGRSAAGPTRP